MKKIILTFISLGFLMTHTYASNKMEPLAVVAKKVFTKNPKNLEVAYFTGRCGAVYYFTSTFFESLGSEELIVKRYAQLGKKYVRVAVYLSKKYGSSEFLAIEQVKGFINEYSSRVNTERKTYDTTITDDIEICDSYSAQISELADAIE